MCVYSMVADHYGDEWQRRWDKWLEEQRNNPPPPQPIIPVPPLVTPPLVTQEEIDMLERLLEKAKKYDKEHNQPDCEMEEKKELLRKLAEKLGINLDFIVKEE
jgi:hypothetical protein